MNLVGSKNIKSLFDSYINHRNINYYINLLLYELF